MCRRPKGKSASVCSYSLSFKMYCIHGTYAGECHTQQNELQNGAGSGRWPTDAHRTATSFSLRIQPKIFTITLKATYILIWPSSKQREVEKKNPKKNSSSVFANFSPVILSLCSVLFIYFFLVRFILRMWCGEQRYQPSKVVLQDPVGVIKLDFNQSGCSVQQIVFNYLSEVMAGLVLAAGER